MAAEFWLLHASMSRIAAWPRVLPSPIMPNKTVPGGCNSVELDSSPSLVIVSRVARILQNATSPLLTQGILPPQYSDRPRLGVAPTCTSHIALMGVEPKAPDSADTTLFPSPAGSGRLAYSLRRP